MAYCKHQWASSKINMTYTEDVVPVLNYIAMSEGILAGMNTAPYILNLEASSSECLSSRSGRYNSGVSEA
jgi:hypothetical protein